MNDHIDIWSKGEVFNNINKLIQLGKIKDCNNLKIIQENKYNSFRSICLKDFSSREPAKNVSLDITAYSAPSGYSWPICPKDCPHYTKSENLVKSMTEEQENIALNHSKTTPQHCEKEKDKISQNTEKENIVKQHNNLVTPDKITLKWLWEHLSIQYYITFFVLLTFIFSLGLYVAETTLYQSVIKPFISEIRNNKINSPVVVYKIKEESTTLKIVKKDNKKKQENISNKAIINNNNEKTEHVEKKKVNELQEIKLLLISNVTGKNYNKNITQLRKNRNLRNLGPIESGKRIYDLNENTYFFFPISALSVINYGNLLHTILGCMGFDEASSEEFFEVHKFQDNLHLICFASKAQVKTISTLSGNELKKVTVLPYISKEMGLTEMISLPVNRVSDFKVRQIDYAKHDTLNVLDLEIK